MVPGGPELGGEDRVLVADNRVGEAGVSDCKVNKDLRKPRCIDRYLHRLVANHFL